MAMKGRSVLFICNDIPVEEEDGFNDWYIREHLPERANGLPGFNRGRRYRALYDTPRYMALYEVDGPEALQSPEYLAIVHDPDPRSRRYIPMFERPVRTVFSVVASAGIGEGGVVAVLAYRAAPGSEPEVRRQMTELVTGALPSSPGIIAAHVLEKDETVLAASRTGHLRKGDRELAAALLIEAIDEPSLRALRRDVLSDARLSEAGVGGIEIFGVFSLLMTLTKGG
jgi:hypothetical protein